MTANTSISQMKLERMHALASELAGRFADIRLLAEDLQRTEIGKPATILNALTQLANEANSTLLWYKNTIGWHSFRDVLQKLGNPHWTYTESDPIDDEVMAKAICPMCDSADRTCETIKYWDYLPTYQQGDKEGVTLKRQPIACCNQCRHCELI